MFLAKKPQVQSNHTPHQCFHFQGEEIETSLKRNAVIDLPVPMKLIVNRNATQQILILGRQQNDFCNLDGVGSNESIDSKQIN